MIHQIASIPEGTFEEEERKGREDNNDVAAEAGGRAKETERMTMKMKKPQHEHHRERSNEKKLMSPSSSSSASRTSSSYGTKSPVDTGATKNKIQNHSSIRSRSSTGIRTGTTGDSSYAEDEGGDEYDLLTKKDKNKTQQDKKTKNKEKRIRGQAQAMNNEAEAEAEEKDEPLQNNNDILTDDSSRNTKDVEASFLHPFLEQISSSVVDATGPRVSFASFSSTHKN
jgi:hypothetical protein